MTWVRLDDGFATHPKILGLSDASLRVLLESYCYAAQHMTDGLLAPAVASRLGTRKARTELVSAGLWDETPEGVVIHDYLTYNPSRAEVEERRDYLHQVRAAAGRKGGLKSGETRSKKASNQ